MLPQQVWVLPSFEQMNKQSKARGETQDN